MKRIALYFRVSTDDQTTEPQRIELREYCARRGWENVTEYADKISGAKFTRLGLNRLMADARAHRIDAVVCVKMDRLGRSLSHMAQLLAELEFHNVALICPGQGIDTSEDNPAGKLQRGILMCVAEFEKDLIRERTMAGLAAARARGSRLGRPPEELSENAIMEITAFLSKASGSASTYGELASRTSLSKSNVFNICARARAVWNGMKARCSNPEHEAFPRYGGRGIKVCERWEVFENFISDMGISP
ncbi:MAG: recombinase family protein, partial [Terrimicrobiaceae bacterium]